MIYTITLNPSVDKFIRVDHLAKDDTIRGTDLHQDPGGKGINVSRALKELGAQTKAFGIIGGCSGYMLKSYMMDRAIPFDYTEVVDETRINVIISDVSDSSQTRISLPGPEVRPDDMENFLGLVRKANPKPSFWVMGGSIPRGFPKEIYKTLIESLQKDGGRCVLDADDEALQIGVRARPFMIKPNEFELCRLVNEDLSGFKQFAESAQDLACRGISVVLVSLGQHGVIVATSDRKFRVIPPEVKPKSKVGAGDCAVAGILSGLERNLSLEESAKFGVAAGTAAVLNEGTRLCKKEDVDRILKQVAVEEI